jgi:hypothetical protein
MHIISYYHRADRGDMGVFDAFELPFRALTIPRAVAGPAAASYSPTHTFRHPFIHRFDETPAPQIDLPLQHHVVDVRVHLLTYLYNKIDD